MRQVRYEMGDDVQGIVESARLMADWQYYVRSYPWLCLGIAVAAGYIVVPNRLHVVKPDPKDLVELVKAHQIRVNADVQQSGGISNRIMNMAAGMIVQGALALLSGQLNNFLNRAMRQENPAQDERGRRHEEPHH